MGMGNFYIQENEIHSNEIFLWLSIAIKKKLLFSKIFGMLTLFSTQLYYLNIFFVEKKKQNYCCLVIYSKKIDEYFLKISPTYNNTIGCPTIDIRSFRSRHQVHCSSFLCYNGHSNILFYTCEIILLTRLLIILYLFIM